MNEFNLVVSVLAKSDKPLGEKEVATLCGLDPRVVNKVFKELKKQEKIVSPIRCKWELK